MPSKPLNPQHPDPADNPPAHGGEHIDQSRDRKEEQENGQQNIDFREQGDEHQQADHEDGQDQEAVLLFLPLGPVPGVEQG